MTIDQTGLDFIKGFEGFSPVPYNDVVGKSTVGYGHLIKSGEDFSMGISLSQGETLLYDDLEGVEARILQLAPTTITQNQFNALCSFAFNLGVGALEQMMAHGWSEASNQIPRWTHAGGVVLPGLVRRRAAEVKLFNTVSG